MATNTRICYDDVLSLPDILSTDNFILYLNAPTLVQSKLGSSFTDMQNRMVIKCQSTSLPGFSNEAFDVAMHGFVMKQRGQKKYTNTLAATYIEEANMDTYKYLYAWSEVVCGTYTGKSEGYKNSVTAGSATRYASDACYLELFDTTGATVDKIGFLGLFPQEVQDINLSVENSAAVQISVTFSYDLFYRIGGGYVVNNQY